MNEDFSKKRLGRGLAALIGEIDKPVVEKSESVRADGQVDIELVRANPKNPRRKFDEADLADLAHSVTEHGIMQPVVVRPRDNGSYYEIIAGERRWRAAQKAGLRHIPIIVRDVDDRVALELAIIENVQRADLNPLEEALGYQQLIDEHNYTQSDLGNVIGKSRSHVANTLRLLKLPDEVQELLTTGQLSAGHARTLITADNPSALAEKIIANGLSVRQAEALAQAPLVEPSKKSAPAEKDADTLALEKILTDVIGLKVQISHREKGGDLKIIYKTLDQLDDLCRRLQQ
ncbi:ParB/RepB/Spo0J family partition protein [Limoniibacter endophyticus]|uniref:Chromosome partitioning protein ParB n=1 Tax=Limoniibacter endophyticus TaxID=1565040 RepID=A0A8J3DJH6_9HYPH|nr:ParB/RepB/Spo0J family partition protein [Limoniibacter endophyticus]GHC74358.1 chromosome partitioning protein ParB [Limoniibacter endophyticus]